MAIPLEFLTRYAIPLIVALIYLGDVDIPQQMQIFDKTERLSDEALSKARGEGEGNEIFDYIIVGGGAAGALLANRLSASGQDKILLLDAGGDPNPIYDVPAMAKYFWMTEVNKWTYYTTKQERACLENDGICFIPRGICLGGSSSVNGLQYNRGKPKDYDQWANFTGDQSWSWDNVKETYNSFEDYHGFYEGRNHGSGGEMYVGKIDYIPGVEIFQEAIEEKGWQMGDPNGGKEFTYGFSLTDYNFKHGVRSGTYQAFLQPILDRGNLKIYRHAYATKIEIELGEVEHRASGVTYERHGVVRTASARKEVIISGGALESPKLLMLSGIGPKEHLDVVGIETIVDLPVGKYLQDHTGIEVVGPTGGYLVNTTFARDPNTTENLLQFITDGTGPLNAFGPSTQIMTGYFNTASNPDRDWPDIHTYVVQNHYPSENRQEFSFSIELARMDTTGSITLASSDPQDMPIIDLNMFADLNDVERIVDGVEVMRDIFLNSTAFKKIGIQEQEAYSPCSHLDYNSRDYWRCAVMMYSGAYFHPTSTCRIGPNREVAVLDSKLKVFGMKNLRVVDASSIPFVPSGNTNLPTMLVAARAAEIILSD